MSLTADQRAGFQIDPHRLNRPEVVGLYEVVPPPLQRRASSIRQHNIGALRQCPLLNVSAGGSVIQELIVYARRGDGLEQGHADDCVVDHGLEYRRDYLGPAGGTERQHQFGGPFSSWQVASSPTSPASDKEAAAPDVDVPPPFALSGASPSLHARHEEQRFLFLFESFEWLHRWHGHDEARRVADRRSGI